MSPPEAGGGKRWVAEEGLIVTFLLQLNDWPRLGLGAGGED